MTYSTLLLALASTAAPISIDSQCDGRFASYTEWSTKAHSEADLTAIITDRFKRDTDAKLAKDKATLEDANQRNKNIKIKTIDVGSFEGVKLKATIASGYYSLKDLFMGKTEAVIWQQKDGRAFPLYSVSSCHYNSPEITAIKTSHGTYLSDKALANIAGVGKAPIYWKIFDGSALRTSIDKALESEASKVVSSKKVGDFALAAGFDLESLTYKGNTKTPNDCAACYTGPSITIKLIPQKEGYKAESKF
jgi:hypothetical protein